MKVRLWIWPRYALEVGDRRVVIPNTAGAAISRLFYYARRHPGHFISTDELIEAAYFDRADGGPLWARDCVKVAIHKARKILRRIGVDIEGDRGRGHGGFRLVIPSTTERRAEWRHRLRPDKKSNDGSMRSRPEGTPAMTL